MLPALALAGAVLAAAACGCWRLPAAPETAKPQAPALPRVDYAAALLALEVPEPPQLPAVLGAAATERPPKAAFSAEYVADCVTRLHVAPSQHMQPVTTDEEKRALLIEGDHRLSNARQAMEQRAPAKQVADTALDALVHYRRALFVDPYSPRATLALALAYDLVRRKGCALALLQRLDALTQHPERGAEAKRLAQDVAATFAWFCDYRKDAMAALDQ